MKQIHLLILVFMMNGLANAQTDQPFIEVKGVGKIERTVKSYIIDILLTGDALYDEKAKPVEVIRRDFFEKLKTAGFDVALFKEDQLNYALTQYNASGSLYSFETNKEADVIALHKLTNNKSGTINIINRRIVYQPVNDMDKVYAAAFADGKARAEKMARAMGKKVITLLSVTDYSLTNIETEEIAYYKGEEEPYYSLSLRFSIQ